MVPWGWTALAVGGACAFVLLCDIALRGYHQRSAAMDVVWPLTALYLGPLGAWLYLRHARPATARWVSRHPEDVGGTVVGAPRGTAADHCGAWGAVCLLASLAGGGLAQLLSPTPVLPLEPEQAVSLAALGIGDLALACLFGLVFRRLSHEQSAARRTLVRIAAFQLPVLACIAVKPPPVPAVAGSTSSARRVAPDSGRSRRRIPRLLGRGWVATPIDGCAARRDDPRMAPGMGADARAMIRSL